MPEANGKHQGSKMPAERRLGPFSVSPVGLGAMRLTGPNVFGPPASREDAIELLRSAVAVGVNHIDTAEYYGPTVVNELIRDALFPYPSDLVIVSKVGARRGRRGEVLRDDEPARLRIGIEDNLKTLGTDQIGAVNLRIMRDSGPDLFFDSQLEAMMAAREQGQIRAIGLSNVSLAHLEHALQLTDIACVQNAFNPVDRTSQPVLDECTRRGVAFVPFAPLGFGTTSVLGNSALTRVASRIGCTPAQACLAWQLAMAPNLLLIAGMSSLHHLHENMAASAVQLEGGDLQEISNQ
jgi:pyridoxine 4-dehydrogenase